MTTLSTGHALTTRHSLRSGAYRLVMQSDGNLVLYGRSKALWSTGTIGRDADRLVVQSDGNLVLYSSKKVPLWSSCTAGDGPDRLVLQSDGNLVLTARSTIAWRLDARSRHGKTGRVKVK